MTASLPVRVQIAPKLERQVDRDAGRAFRREGRRRYELAFPALTAGADIVGQ